jgi:exosortase/archaeosortase family protein
MFGVSRHPRLSWFLALGLTAGLLAFVAYDQSHWWASEPDYAFGFLTPLFCLYITCERWPLVNRSLDAAQAPGAPRMQGLRGFLVGAGAFALLGVGGVGVTLGSLMRADSSVAEPSATLTITLGSIFASFGLLFICIPAPPAGSAARSLGRDSRLSVLSLFVFPIGIWLLSARLLGVVEDRLSLFLQGKVVGFVSLVFDLVGATIIREGNVLLLPTGRVGVAEACSGMRSLTGCLFSGAFLGAVFFRGLAPKVFLLLAALLLAFCTNLARNLFLTFWAYRYGPPAIHGWVHDVAGYAVLGLTTLGLLLVVGLMKRLGGIGIEFSEPKGSG